MKIHAALALIAVGVSVSGCATIISGVHQPVNVATTPVNGADCTLTNSEGSWHVTTPGNVVVHRSKSDLNVICTKAGYAPANVVYASKFENATLGNVLAGGIVGLGVDAASGATNYYDSPITVPLGEPTDKASADKTPAPTAASPAAAKPTS